MKIFSKKKLRAKTFLLQNFKNQFFIYESQKASCVNDYRHFLREKKGGGDFFQREGEEIFSKKGGRRDFFRKKGGRRDFSRKKTVKTFFKEK